MIKILVLIAVLLTGCISPLKPGSANIGGPGGISLKQSQNPADSSTQVWERSFTSEPAIRLPDEPPVKKTTWSEKISTTIGASQKDTARELSAKLKSLKGVVWVGVLLFVFGAASAFWPPLKLIVGSVTTSAVACAAGIALIVLPSLIAGNEILILGVAGGAVGLYFFSHRYGKLRSKVELLDKK